MKKMLKELTKEEIEKVYNTNERLRNELYQVLAEENDFIWSEEYDVLLKFNKDYVRYHDNYNSFYLTIKNEQYEDFINLLNDDEMIIRNLMNESEKAEITQLYEDSMNNNPMNYTESEVEENEQVIQSKYKHYAELFLQRIENYLHQFEDVDEESVKAQYEVFIDENADNTHFYVDENYVLYHEYTKIDSYK